MKSEYSLMYTPKNMKSSARSSVQMSDFAGGYHISGNKFKEMNKTKFYTGIDKQHIFYNNFYYESLTGGYLITNKIEFTKYFSKDYKIYEVNIVPDSKIKLHPTIDNIYLVDKIEVLVPTNKRCIIM